MALTAGIVCFRQLTIIGHDQMVHSLRPARDEMYIYAWNLNICVDVYRESDKDSIRGKHLSMSAFAICASTNTGRGSSEQV